MNKFWHNHKRDGACVVISICFVVLSLGSALRESLVYDEVFYIQEGIANLTAKTFSDPYNPPLVRELTALPLVFFSSNLPKSDIAAIRYFPARFVTISLGVLLLLSIYMFVKRRVGPIGAIFAVLFLAFDPTVLAHSHYVTSDIGVTLFFFLTYWAWLTMLRRPTWTHAMLFGISMGLAFASKLSAIPYVFVSAAISLFLEKKMAGFRWMWQKKHFMILSFVIASCVVWSTYFFQTNVIIAARDDANRVSERIVQYAKNNNFPLVVSLMYILEHQPVILGQYFATVKNTLLRPPVVPGEMEGSMLANFFLKLPIPLMVFFAIGLWQPNVTLYVIPVVAVLAVSLSASTMPWVRYLLPMYPFVAIIAGIGIRNIRGKIIITIILFWYLMGTLVSFPHFISYANKFVSRQERYLYFTDSNIDWGQSLPDIADYVQREKPSHLSLSYFGRDNGNAYGLVSNKAWGSYRFEEICAFHEIALPYKSGKRMIAISVSNWYGCGYSKTEQFSKQKIQSVIADSILIF